MTFQSYSWFTDSLTETEDLLSHYSESTEVCLLAKRITAEECKLTDVRKDDQYSLFRAHMAGHAVPRISEKTMLDARFRVLMAYYVIDVYDMMNSVRLRPPSASGPIADNVKAPMRQLNNVPALIERSQKALNAHLLALHAKAC
ncbi:hypothetical protein C0995_008827 [Termitomyces sp. Mi166|nr:hypothetical protein C0995_008827 [Termitomyces sp. Mi166\